MEKEKLKIHTRIGSILEFSNTDEKKEVILGEVSVTYSKRLNKFQSINSKSRSDLLGNSDPMISMTFNIRDNFLDYEAMFGYDKFTDLICRKQIKEIEYYPPEYTSENADDYGSEFTIFNLLADFKNPSKERKGVSGRGYPLPRTSSDRSQIKYIRMEPVNSGISVVKDGNYFLLNMRCIVKETKDVRG